MGQSSQLTNTYIYIYTIIIVYTKLNMSDDCDSIKLNMNTRNNLMVLSHNTKLNPSDHYNIQMIYALIWLVL